MKMHNWDDNIAAWDEASSAHSAFTLEFSKAISQQSKTNALAGQDDLCLLGQWLLSAGMSKQSRKNYQRLFETHADFHEEAGLVADAINRGDYEEALALLQPGGRYSYSLEHLRAAIFKIKHELEERTTVYPVRLELPVSWR